MVLESLFPARKIVNKPVDMLILSIIVTLASVFVANTIFPVYSGIIAPLLVTVAMTPVFFRAFSIEEEVERKQARHKLKQSFFDRHDETIWLFSYFFLGNFIMVLLLGIIMPQSFVETAFAQQITEITAIRGIGGAFLFSGILGIILTNNLKVMIFSFALSFLYGTGALFILSWNASILGIFFANFVRLGLYDQLILTTAGILPHAPIEIFAYFMAGIAGGILSVGLIREKISSKEFKLIFIDSLKLLLIGIMAVIVGALIEVFA